MTTQPNNEQALEITLKKIVSYCEYENTMQRRVYPKRIEDKKISREKARENYAIIQQFRALAVEALNKGLTWEQVKTIIQEQPATTGGQAQMQLK